MLTKIKSLGELFGIELNYAYDCEQKLADQGLPAMIEAATSPELRSALQHHLQETRGQVARLEKVFSMAGMNPDTKDNDVLDKLLSAAKDSASNIEPSPLRDTALIVNGNLVEHYEIATYGSLAALARQLGLQGVVELLEEEADAKLTQIAESSMNRQAARHQAA